MPSVKAGNQSRTVLLSIHNTPPTPTSGPPAILRSSHKERKQELERQVLDREQRINEFRNKTTVSSNRSRTSKLPGYGGLYL
jgi:hypothetical protein